MQNTALREYLQTNLAFLGRKPGRGGRKYGFDDLRKAADISRTTLYSWLGGTPATPDNAEKLANGLAKLAAVSVETAPELKSKSPTDLKNELAYLLTNPVSDTWGEFKAFAYPPVSGTQGWTFLGTVVERFLQSSGRQPEEVEIQECDIAELRLATEGAVLVGFFAMPDRMAEWNYIRIPINVPLNALYLERDFEHFVSGARKKYPMAAANEEDWSAHYLRNLRAALWQNAEIDPHDELPLLEELRPITASDEAGRSFMVQSHSFLETALAVDEPDEPSADGFLRKLSKISAASKEAPSGLPRTETGSTKLPICVVDELTCLRIRQLYSQTKLPKRTRAQLLSEPASEADDTRRVWRPQYAITLAVRRDRSTETLAGNNSFEATKLSFEEFVRSNAAMIANQYVRLYASLLSDFGKIIGWKAPLYLLRWLSLEIKEADLGHPRLADDRSDRWVLNPELNAWRDVLYSARAIIINDPVLSQGLRVALGMERVDATAAPAQS